MEQVLEYLPFILGGLPYTLGISLASMVAAAVVGLVVGLLRASPHRSRWFPALAFIEFVRGISEVVQFYWIFFAFPVLLAIRIDPLTAAVIVIGMVQGAYTAEIVRGALLAVPKPQREATIALNFGRLDAMRHVIFPQAFATMLPSLGNIAVDIVKNTSIVSLVTVADLTFRVQSVRSQIGHSYLLYGLLMLIYLALAALIGWAFRGLERRLPAGLRDNGGRVR